MSKLYLLGFVRDCPVAPALRKLPVNLSGRDRLGVLWCPNLQAAFPGKEEFLVALLDFYRYLCEAQISFIPIQTGVRAGSEEDILRLLDRYQVQLADCFELVSGCREYCLNAGVQTDACAGQVYPGANSRCRSGKEYLEHLQRNRTAVQARARQAQETVNMLVSRLKPWSRDHWKDSEASPDGKVDMAFLVPVEAEQDFLQALSNTGQELEVDILWSGPWPPFHFSTFSLKPDESLVRETLDWGRGEDRYDRPH